MKYKILGSCLKLYDSYMVPKSRFSKELEKIRNLHPSCRLWSRSEASLKREWATHNLLYSLGMYRERTADCDLNYEQKWFVRLGYFIVGTFALLVIK